MGIFSLFKKKTQSEKNKEYFQKFRNQTIINETKSIMHDTIVSSQHDSSLLDENPKGDGEFGLVKTNPVPIYGIDNIPAYMDKLRYKYTSKSGSFTYNHVDFIRTSDDDKSNIGSKKTTNELSSSSTSSQNISGHIDVYNIYSIGGEKLAKIYVNCYSLKTSNKIIDGFIHRDEVPVEKDSKILMEAMKQIG
jgi:hypothetical protein